MEALSHSSYNIVAAVAESDSPHGSSMVEVELQHAELLGCGGDPESRVGVSTVCSTSTRDEISPGQGYVGEVD